MSDQPKKTCGNCFNYPFCNRVSEGRESCGSWTECLPPPPPKTPPCKPPRKGTKQIVVIKVKSMISSECLDAIRERFFEQAKTGIVVADERLDIYNLTVPEDFPSDVIVEIRQIKT